MRRVTAKRLRKCRNWLAEFAPGGVKVLSLDDIGLRGEIEENGNSFEENSFIKACAAARLGYFGIADDSGLCVDALGGRPGIFSARYSGENANDRSNNDKLLSELEYVPDSERGAHFVCVVTCALPQNMSDVLIPAEYAGFSSDDGIRSFYGPAAKHTVRSFARDAENRASATIRCFSPKKKTEPLRNLPIKKKTESATAERR